MYENYYLRQARQRGSGDMPAFVGARYQRGHGLGSIFGKIRAAMPWFIRKVGSNVMKTAFDVGQDVLSGKRVGDVIGSRILEGVKSTAEEVGPSVVGGIKDAAKGILSQSGSGRKRLKKVKRISNRKHHRGDIFG